jgi:CBS domain-containing protein
MRIREVMSTPVHTVPPRMRLDEAAAVMRQHSVRHLVVKDASRIVGVLSHHDLAESASDADAKRVEDLMSLNVVTIKADETVRKAANLMRGRNVGCLAVTERGTLAGIITLSDLLILLGKGGERRVPAARASTHYRVPHRRQHNGTRW